jgi:hypothetical protein
VKKVRKGSKLLANEEQPKPPYKDDKTPKEVK